MTFGSEKKEAAMSDNANADTAISCMKRPVTPELLAKAMQAGQQAMELHQRMMERVVACATLTAFIAEDGTIKNGGYDADTELRLSGLRTLATDAYNDAAKRVLGL